MKHEITPERWQQIERLYHSALEHDSSQRGAYLQQACAGDDVLREEVESLLAHEKTTDGLLDHSALGEIAAEIFAKRDGRSLLGTKLGSYQVLTLLGAGGMGEVYQAHDNKLRRDVAIKVLPAAFMHDAERLARFEREARMLAALNHPNIATIYGLEHSDGVHYLVMELVPGQTLAERVCGGPLPIKEALALAGQIADALEAAHEKGVIHRDLKPANVKVTPEGKVKVLDFGLAKAFAGHGELGLSKDLTLTAMGTEDGRILGTPAYMSPEQARGKPVDKRTDIWAFGCVLYELLTGKRAFRGETLQDALAAVLEREPDLQALPSSTPAKIRDLLRRCLQKDINRRFRDAADIGIEIEEVLTAPASEGQPSASAPASRPQLQQAFPWSVAAVLAIVALFVTVALFRRAPAETPPIRFTIGPPEKGSFNPNPMLLAISPDGSKLAFIAADSSGKQQLWIRALDSPATQPLPGTENVAAPFWSADSSSLGFYADGKLKKIAVTGGPAQTLAEALGGAVGGTWSREGVVLIAPSTIYRVSASGGTITPVTTLDASRQENFHAWPYFLPDGKHFLYFAHSTKTENDAIYVGSLDSKERKLLLNANSNAVYVSPGYILFNREGTLMAQPFDAERMQLTGEAVPIVEGVEFNGITGSAAFAASDNGVLAYRGGGGATFSRLVWVNRNGTEQALAAPPRAYIFPRLSPDGRRLAASIVEQGQAANIWLYDLSREALTRLTFEGNRNRSPVWTPDGKRIAFRSWEGPKTNIFWQLADGSGGLERLRTSSEVTTPSSFSADSQLLAFVEGNPATGQDIWVLRLSDRKAQPFLQTKFNETDPAFSPDGRWLAYRSDKSGRPEIYVQPYPGPGGEWQISTEGGIEPVWNPNGRELFYRSGDKMMAVGIVTHPGFSAGKPRMLFAGQYVGSGAGADSGANYDVSPDGQRFLMLKPTEQAQAAPTQINVVLNWFEELKQKVPVGKK